MTIDGHLLNDLWCLDLDNMQWTHCTCYGYTPTPRKGNASSTCMPEFSMARGLSAAYMFRLVGAMKCTLSTSCCALSKPDGKFSNVCVIPAASAEPQNRGHYTLYKFAVCNVRSMPVGCVTSFVSSQRRLLLESTRYMRVTSVSKKTSFP